MSEKRFSYEYSENSAMVRIIDREKEEPNGWSMCNVAYTVKRLNEQQATIERLEEENEQLRQQAQNAKEIAVKNDMQYQICRKEKEDFQDMCEQLRKELDNFKPVMFQDMRKGTVILYSKGDTDV